ncbi:MAG: alpha/beta hydrolase [Gemmatimonadaceae bacterium]
MNRLIRHGLPALLGGAIVLTTACAPLSTIAGGASGAGGVVPVRAPRGLFTEKRFGVRVTPGLVYGSAAVRQPSPATMQLRLDLYEPTGANLPASRPGVILLHGGGFNGGDRSNAMTSGLCRELAGRGYVCGSIDYRLQGDAPPTTGATPRERAALAAMEDAGTALQWMRGNASQYGVDASRTVVGGGSAGAAVAMLLTYSGVVSGPPAAAVIDLWGSMDAYVDNMKSGAPPIIIIHGMYDPTVPISEAQKIANRAQSVGVPYAFLPLPSKGHTHDLGATVQGETLYQHIANFLFTNLRLSTLAG